MLSPCQNSYLVHYNKAMYSFVLGFIKCSITACSALLRQKKSETAHGVATVNSNIFCYSWAVNRSLALAIITTECQGFIGLLFHTCLSRAHFTFRHGHTDPFFDTSKCLLLFYFTMNFDKLKYKNYKIHCE